MSYEDWIGLRKRLGEYDFKKYVYDYSFDMDYIERIELVNYIEQLGIWQVDDVDNIMEKKDVFIEGVQDWSQIVTDFGELFRRYFLLIDDFLKYGPSTEHFQQIIIDAGAVIWRGLTGTKDDFNILRDKASVLDRALNELAVQYALGKVAFSDEMKLATGGYVKETIVGGKRVLR